MIYVLGGIGSAKAAISVTYPSGSTCTCTKGSRTLRAKDTSGSYLFLIPEAGAWTVSCTDGTKTVSKSVTITAQYQSENVSLSYGLYLYNSGDECIDVTGGWRQTGGGSLSKESDNLYLTTAGTSQIGIAQTANTLSRGGYTTLHAIVSSRDNDKSEVGITNTTEHGGQEMRGVIAETKWENSSKTMEEIVIPISSVSGSNFFFFACMDYQGNSWMRLYKMWLE